MIDTMDIVDKELERYLVKMIQVQEALGTGSEKRRFRTDVNRTRGQAVHEARGENQKVA